MRFTLSRKLAAEAVGTALLVATVVGSGIMGDALSPDDGVALLANTLPTGAILVVLITLLGPISGAHFNPAVTAAFLMRREIAPPEAGAFVVAQCVGGAAGAILANLMFALPAVAISQTLRSAPNLWLAEIVATFGLVGAILLGLAFRREAIPWIVGLYITAAYWFTASTSFANPAVTIGRMFTDTFSGIAPASAPAFFIAQMIGAAIAVAAVGWLLKPAGAEAAAARSSV